MIMHLPSRLRWCVLLVSRAPLTRMLVLSPSSGSGITGRS